MRSRLWHHRFWDGELCRGYHYHSKHDTRLRVQDCDVSHALINAGGRERGAILCSNQRQVVDRQTGSAGTRTVSVVFHPGYAGQFEDTLELVFWHLDLHRAFVITRRVKATIGDRDDYEQIKPEAPYTGPKQVPRFNYDRVRVVLSLRPPTWTETVWTERLPEYKVPEKVVEAAFGPPPLGNKRTRTRRGQMFKG
ncbi:hypothetical protein FA13DRAFT_966055 [Coprinellus micaceus]|uniref:Uncharacterized protein n=1 Tax=Coprinellus micaceus TaxID=71717 RepID=A0A4Y7RWE4_COPMI|nr:hypothetical protein FA13DRAFT_966055 [Coprinellus micaceus]